MSRGILLSTDFAGLKLHRRGKVRDIYELGDELLIVSSDRISCFDVVLPDGIPNKGRVLNSLSCFWFDFTSDIIRNHFITSRTEDFPKELEKFAKDLRGRSMLVLKTKPLPVECVIRGYLAGSGWKEYKEKQEVCGVKLPGGLLESDRLPEIIFTPSTKADTGHDMNVTQEYVEGLLGKELAAELARISIELYSKAGEYALARGIIIADTKFEFGLHNGKLILIDEILTPDSSRFWPVSLYARGRPQASFDKQFVRDYLETLDWDKSPPAPKLPREIIEKTSRKYLEAHKRITGKELGE